MSEKIVTLNEEVIKGQIRELVHVSERWINGFCDPSSSIAKILIDLPIVNFLLHFQIGFHFAFCVIGFLAGFNKAFAEVVEKFVALFQCGTIITCHKCTLDCRRIGKQHGGKINHE